MFGIAVVGRVDVGEGVAEVARLLVEVGDRVFDRLGVEPVAGMELQRLLDRRRREVAKRALGVDLAELVARPLLDDVGDDEVLAVGRQLGKRRDDAEVGIALGQIEGAKLLLVGREPVRIVGVVRLEEAEDSAGLARVHLLAQAFVVKLLVADDVDRPDLGQVAFVDFEHDVDAVLVELDDLGLDARGEAALAAIKLEDPVDVGARGRAGEDLARRELDLRA